MYQSSLGQRPRPVRPAGGLRAGYSIILALGIAVVLLFESCATAPYAFSFDPLGILDQDAPWYAVLPVEENRSVFEAFSESLESGTSFMKDIERASVLYLAGHSRNREAGETLPFSLVATGSFPSSMSGLAFSKKDGWEKMGSRRDGVWYRNGRMGAAIPRAGLLCMSDPSLLPGMLNAIRNPPGEEVPAPPEFREAIPRSGSGDGTIALYIRDRHFISETMLKGTNLELPIQGILVLAKRVYDTGNYRLVFRMYFPDERTARAMVPMVRLVFTGSAQLDGTTLVFDLSMKPEDIADLLKFVYF